MSRKRECGEEEWVWRGVGDGEPDDLLKKGDASPAAKPAPSRSLTLMSLKIYIATGLFFSLTLMLSGEPLWGAAAAVITLAMAVFARKRVRRW